MLRTTIGGSLPKPDAHKDFAPVVNSKGESA